MTVQIALLRGINVGGKRMTMADLRALLAELGYEGAKTLLASGNIAFDAGDADPAQVVARLEAGIEAHFGFSAQVLLRTAAAVQAVIDAHPFTPAQLDQPKYALVYFLRAAPSEDTVAAFQAQHDGPEVVTVAGDVVYIYYGAGVGRSKLTNNTLEKALGVASTGRNWNTVNKLVALANEM